MEHGRSVCGFTTLVARNDRFTRNLIDDGDAPRRRQLIGTCLSGDASDAMFSAVSCFIADYYCISIKYYILVQYCEFFYQ